MSGTATFLDPMGGSGFDTFPSRLGLQSGRSAPYHAPTARRAGILALLSGSAVVDGKPAQIRAIECLRAGTVVDESGVRRKLTMLDMIQLEAAPTPPLRVSAGGRVVGVVFGVLLIGERLFAVTAISEQMAADIYAGRWIAASADVAMKAASETRSGVTHELAGISLHRQTPPGVTKHLPLLLASPVVRAMQKIGHYEPEINAVLSVAVDVHAYGENFVGAVGKTQNAFSKWREQ